MSAIQAQVLNHRAGASSAEDDADSRSSTGRPSAWFSHPLSVFVAPALVLVGLVLLVVGYVGVANREIDALQIHYLVSGGLGGLFALGCAVGFAGVRELRLTNERLVDVDRKVSMLGEAVEDVLDDIAGLKQAQHRSEV